MEYEVRYDGRYRNDVLDWRHRINARKDCDAIIKAARYVDALNKEAVKKRTSCTYKLTDIYRIRKKRVMVIKEKFTSIWPSR
ncbi:MAG: hypothetical protein HYT63_03615 [Candidatus Yanofskybacteria bacterium]|nr:hypothetical protein [Candidatus Yanofskybacteria bacterium]